MGHDAWTTHQLLTCSKELADEQLDREFDMSHRSVRATFQHLVRNMEVWSDLMAGRPPRAAAGDSIDELTVRQEKAAGDLAEVARAVAGRDGWDDLWTDWLDTPPTRKTYGGALAHVITHSMHHRAQLIYMLRQLGVENLPEGDVLSWEKQRNEPRQRP